MTGLPDGFTIDQGAQPAANLPAGFTLDQSAPIVSTATAAGRGAADTLSFGLHPAMRGLMSAAGEPENAPASVGSLLQGGARMFHEKVVQPLLGQDAGGEATQSYERGRQAAANDQRLAQEAHPVAYLSGQLAGALTAPAFGVAGGATAAGRIGAGARAGAISGGLYGAGEAVSEGDSLPGVALEGGRGALTGAAFGTAGAGVMEAARPLGQRIAAVARGITNPDDEAARRVAQSLAADWQRVGPRLSPEEIAAANAAGTPRALVDAGDESTRALARSAANTSPEGRSALVEMTQDRFEQQSPRIAGFIRQITGGGDAAGDLAAIQNVARRVNRPAYRAAYAAGEDGLWTPELERLAGSPSVRQAMQNAVQRGQDRAVNDGFGAFNPGVTFENGVMRFGQGRGAPPYPNMQYWDYVQRELRDMGSAAARTGRNEEAGALKGLHRQLLAELDQANPEFGQARQGAAGYFGAENALEAGHKFAQSTLASPQAQLDAQRAFNRFTPLERGIFARGYASNLADMVERSPDNRNVLNAAFLNNGPARQRTLMALGPQNAAQLEALLRAERIVDRARTNLGNSTTARQLMEMGLAGGATAGAEGLVNHDFNPAHIITAAVATGLARRGAQVIDQRVAGRVGEMLASSDPAILARGAQVAARTPWIFNALRQATGGVAKGGTAAVQPLGNSPQKPQIRPPGFQHGGRVNPQNINPNPTDAQKKAGNYAKDHVCIHGCDVTIENAKGAERKGVDRDGKPWSVRMPAHYGYIKGTVGKDKDHVDVYLGPHKTAPKVFIIDQIDADSKKFDEHKTFIGFASKSQAINTYHRAFSDGRGGERFGHVTEMSVDDFKNWLERGDTTKALRYGQKVAA